MAAYPSSPAPPRKYRPRALWFFVGGGLLLLAGVSFVLGLVLALLPLTQEDAVLDADGAPHEVSLPAGEERGLYTDHATVSCTATDAGGSPVEIRGPGGEFTTEEWEAIGRFDTGDGDVVLTCDGPPGTRARVGGIPSVGGLVGGIVLAVVGPCALGLAGLVVLVVTGILWASRPPRPR